MPLCHCPGPAFLFLLPQRLAPMGPTCVSGAAAKAAGPTELWGADREESSLGNEMFQSREVMSKQYVGLRGPWGATGCGRGPPRSQSVWLFPGSQVCRDSHHPGLEPRPHSDDTLIVPQGVRVHQR